MNDNIDFYNGYFVGWLVRVCSVPASMLRGVVLGCCVPLAAFCYPHDYHLPSSQRFLSIHTRDRIWNAEAQTLVTIS